MKKHWSSLTIHKQYVTTVQSCSLQLCGKNSGPPQTVSQFLMCPCNVSLIAVYPFIISDYLFFTADNSVNVYTS